MGAGLAAWLASGRTIDAILIGVVLEAAALAGYRRVTGRGPGAIRMLPTLVAGAMLLLALRAALTGPAALVPAWLAAGLAAHCVDLAARWRR